MKLKVYEGCYSRGYSIDDVNNDNLSRAKKIQLIRKLLIKANNSQLDDIIHNYSQEIGTSIEYESNICEQCGNWNYDNTLEI